MATAALTLYELAAADASVRFSPHCWKTRMALAHKGQQATGIPTRFTDKALIEFSGQGLVPVLVHGGEVVTDSWRIALHLETEFPEQPSLFGSAPATALAAFVNTWADSILLPAIARLIVMDIYECIDAADRDYFRQSREKRFGRSLEAVAADRAIHLQNFQQALSPLRQLLNKQSFVCGEAPAYADYCVFGMFMWARCCSSQSLVGNEDPIFHWREQLLDRFDRLARAAPVTGRMHG